MRENAANPNLNGIAKSPLRIMSTAPMSVVAGLHMDGGAKYNLCEFHVHDNRSKQK
jgi:hypothetical protein